MATETYKYQGSKVPGRAAGRLIVEGSVSKPERYADVGGSLELTDEEVENLKGIGLKLTKINDPEPSEDGTDEGDKSASEQQAAQLEAQTASGAQHPAATSDKDNTPGGKSRQGK